MDDGFIRPNKVTQENDGDSFEQDLGFEFMPDSKFNVAQESKAYEHSPFEKKSHSSYQPYEEINSYGLTSDF